MNALQMVMLVGALVISTPSMAADPQLIEVKPDETADAYFQINVSGKVYVKIAAKPGEEACVDLWWIKWPFGTIEQLGRHCNFASFEIPGFTAFAISSKLRVGGAKNSVKLAVSATEQVAHSVTFTF